MMDNKWGIFKMNRVNYKVLGEKLRKAREYLNLTQAQVADILSVGRDAIIRIENGTRKISAEELLNFSKLYKTSIDELVNNDEYVCTESAFARGFEKLSVNDQKEIINLIKLKNEYKEKNKKG